MLTIFSHFWVLGTSLGNMEKLGKFSGDALLNMHFL